MRTTLLEVAKHYAKIFADLNAAFECLCDESPQQKILAEHLILQTKHHAKNALEEIRNLPEKKE